MRSDLPKHIVFIFCCLANEKLQFLSILFLFLFTWLLPFSYVYSTFLHAWGKHDIRGIYGVWSLLYYHSSLRFESQYFWDGFGNFYLAFFPLYRVGS